MKKGVFLLGPTAVGKSALGLSLAEAFNGEIISADSQQVWRELDIGTAKPTPAECWRVPHHLIDAAVPGEHFDVSRYAVLADKAYEEISARGKVPFLVGGAGLYVRIFLYGLCEAPPQDPQVREELLLRVQKEGLESLYTELKKIDPTAEQKIHPNDKTRIIRSLEVYEQTGYPLSYFHEKHRSQTPRYPVLQIGLDLPREELHKRINSRVDWMMANGWDEEVRELLKFYSAGSQALQSIGYKELVRHLRGELSREEVTEEIKKKTRGLARRQLTWFRGDQSIEWFDPREPSAIWKKVETFLLK